MAKTLCFAAAIDPSILAIVIALAGTPAAAQVPPVLSSAAVDPTIYRDGEVKRFTATVGAWTVVCDEVTRLRQRFCSLRTGLIDNAGVLAAELTISTGQDGRPAALLRMRRALVEGSLEVIAMVAVAPAAPAKVAKRPSEPPLARQRLRPVTCENNICTLIWTLQPAQITALTAGAGWSLVATAKPDPAGLFVLLPPPPPSVTFVVRPDGFKAAVAVSVRPFQAVIAPGKGVRDNPQ